MASTPKPLSISDLSGAVQKAVSGLKHKPPPNSGPYVYINPYLICGIIWIGNLAEHPEAQQTAATIAREVSAHTGVTVAPIVQESGVQESGAAAEHAASPAIPPGRVILGYKPVPEGFVHF